MGCFFHDFFSENILTITIRIFLVNYCISFSPLEANGFVECNSLAPYQNYNMRLLHVISPPFLA